MTQTQKWPEKMTKTRQEMTALGLPGGRKKDGAKVVEDTISAQDRWTTTHDLIFRLPDMPDDLAYSTWYREGSTEQQDEKPWEYQPAECVLVRKVPKVVETWTAEPVSKIPNLRAAVGRSIRVFVTQQWRDNMATHMAGENMTAEWHERLAANVGKRVRVRRMVTHEGDNTLVLQTLAVSLPPGKPYGDKANGCTVFVEEVEYGPIVEPPPRIEVCRLNPDTLVGIAPCDDRSEGWIVMAVQADPDGPGEVIAPVGDEHGEIVYQDILDAAEVLRTGIVWKHDMGEGGPDEDQQDTSSKDSAFEVRIVNGAKFMPRLSWFTEAARVFDERTGKMLKDRNPEAPPCQVVVQYGPERNEFFVKRNSAEVDFNFGPLNRMINGMMTSRKR